VGIDGGQDLLRQPVFFQEMPKPADAALIWNHPAETVKSQKGLETQAVIEGFFHQRITQIVPQLEEMNTQHDSQLMGRTPAMAVIMWMNHFLQLLPRHHLIHLVEKSLNPQGLRFHLVPHSGLHEGYSTGSYYFCRGFYSHFVSGPLLEFGQTRGDAVLMDYTFFDSVELAAYVLDSKVDRRENHNEVDWGVNVEYATEDESIRVGAGYISDLSESQDELLLDFKNIFLRRVPAWNAYALIGMPSFEFTAEILRATHAFQEFPQNADQPFAYNLELAYFPIPWIQIAARLEHSEELMDEPEWQYGVSGTWAPWPNLTVSADYLYGRYKKGFVFDDFENRQLSHHFTVLQLTLSF